MKRNLTEIITRAQARDITVMLTGMEAPPNYGAAYTAEFRQVFRDLGERARRDVRAVLPRRRRRQSCAEQRRRHPSQRRRRPHHRARRSGARSSRCSRSGRTPDEANDRAARRLQDGQERRPSADDSASARYVDPLRPVRGHRRPVGQRQVDAARTARRARRAEHRRDPRSTASTSRSSARTSWRKLRGEKIGFVFQFFHLVPSLTAFENILVPMEIAGRRDAVRARAAAARGSGAVGSRRITIRRSSRAASSSASRSRARSPTIRRSCWRTSRPATSIRRPGATSWSCCWTCTRARHDAGARDARRGARRRSPTRAVAARRRRSVGRRRRTRSLAMTFVLRMALREIRASWQRLLFFFVCIAIGVGSIVALRSVIQSVRVALTREARTLIGADVVVTSERPFDATTVLSGSTREQRAGRISPASEAVEIADDGPPGRSGEPATRMVELRAVRAGVPALRRADAARRRTTRTSCCRARRAGAARAAGAVRSRGRRSISDRHASRSRFAASSTRSRAAASAPSRSGRA